MAYRRTNYKKNRRNNYRKKTKVTMGKKFRTRRGRYGCYKYVNGRKVAFVSSYRRRR